MSSEPISKIINKVQHPSKIIDDGYVQIVDDEITDCEAEIIEESSESSTDYATIETDYNTENKKSLATQVDLINLQTLEEKAEENKGFVVNKVRGIRLTIHQKIIPKLNLIIDYLENLQNNNYILVYEHQNEPDKNGTVKPPHYHLYAQFTKPTNVNSKRCQNANLKPALMSAQLNIAYLKGLDKNERHKHISTRFIYESGAPRYRGGAPNAHDVIRVYQEQGNILSLDSRFYNVNMRIVRDYNQEMAAKQFIENKLKQIENPITVNYHVGQSGAGKTTEICNEYHNHKNYDYAVLTFDDNGFSHLLGKETAKYLLINEFRDSNIKFKDFLEILQNEHQFNIKGGSMYMPNLQQIDITTVQKLHEIYSNCCEDRYQIQRRITHTYYYARGKPRVEVQTIADINYIINQHVSM